MIVVDSAAVVDVLTGAPSIDALAARLAAEDLAAPNLLDVEVVSALRGLVLGGHLSPTRAEDALADFEELTIERWPTSDGMRRRALQLRHNVSAYDATYVCLAEALACPLLTRDRRLQAAVGDQLDVVVL